MNVIWIIIVLLLFTYNKYYAYYIYYIYNLIPYKKVSKNPINKILIGLPVIDRDSDVSQLVYNHIEKSKKYILNYHNIKFDYLTDTDIKAILFDQARQVETMLFQHLLFEPSKLDSNNASYLDWQNKKGVIEKSLKQVKKAINDAGYTKEDLLELLENN